MDRHEALAQVSMALDDLQSLAEAVEDDRLDNYRVTEALQVLANLVGWAGNEELATEHREGLHADTARQDCPLCADFSE